MTSKRITLIVAACAAALAGFLLVKTTASDKGALKPLPAFTLTAHDGTAFTETRLTGKTTLIFFGFTHCPDMCPATLAMLSEALQGVPEGKLTHIQPVFITVDPERDGRAEMTEYLKSFHSGFIGLTGTQDNIDVLVNAVSAYAQKQESKDGAYDVRHSGDTYVINADGQFAGKFPYGTSPQAIIDYLTQ